MADFITVLVIFTIGGTVFACGIYFGAAHAWNRVSNMYRDDDSGDDIRNELGLYTEWSTPIPGREEMRVVSPWRLAE
jgi:hypothetical protein